MIQFEMPISAVAKGRPRFVRRGSKTFALTPERTAAFENTVRAYALKHRPEKPLVGPLYLHVIFYLSRPKKPKFKYPAVRPDLDNFLKALMDGCDKIIWHDDAQVCNLAAAKYYTETTNPYIEVTVGEL